MTRTHFAAADAVVARARSLTRTILTAASALGFPTRLAGGPIVTTSAMSLIERTGRLF